jgi:hypothetical protein
MNRVAACDGLCKRLGHCVVGHVAAARRQGDGAPEPRPLLPVQALQVLFEVNARLFAPHITTDRAGTPAVP